MWVAAVFQRRRASLRLRDGVRERSGFDGPLSSSEPSERDEGAGAVETRRAGSAPNDFIDSVTTEAIDDRRLRDASASFAFVGGAKPRTTSMWRWKRRAMYSSRSHNTPEKSPRLSGSEVRPTNFSRPMMMSMRLGNCGLNS